MTTIEKNERINKAIAQCTTFSAPTIKKFMWTAIYNYQVAKIDHEEAVADLKEERAAALADEMEIAVEEYMIYYDWLMSKGLFCEPPYVFS